jgi:hypothetical protein
LSLPSLGIHNTNADQEHAGLDLSLSTLFIWAVVILFLNQLFSIIKQMQSVSVETMIEDLCAIGIFQYMAWYVVLHLLGSSDAAPNAHWRSFLIVATLCLLLFLPTDRTIWISAAGISVCLWTFSGGDSKLRAAGTVLAALSVQAFWAHVLFNLVAAPLLRAETAIVGTMLEVIRPGTVWQDNVITGPNGFGIVIYKGCSSFHNLALAMLCWLTICKFRNRNWQGRDLIVGAGGSAEQ